MSNVKLKPFLAAASALILAGSLGACSQSAPDNEAEEAVEAAAPDAKPGMSLSDGQLTLPVLAGRPAAVYFAITNGGKEPVTLVSAYVEGASPAEIHETAGGTMKKRDAVEIGPGETVTFERGGLHVMAFDLSDELAEGGTTELTLTFEGGDKLSAPVAIGAAGEAHGMSGMDH